MSRKLATFIATIVLLSVGLASSGEDAKPRPAEAASRGSSSGGNILLDEPRRAGGLTLFPVFGDGKSFRYAPMSPRLARDAQGRPQFSFLRFVENVGGAPGQDAPDEGEGGGIVHAVVTLEVSDAQRDRAQQELQGQVPGAKIVGPLIYESGTFALITSMAAGSSDPAKKDTPKFSHEIVGMGTAPVLEGGKASVSILLTKLGAKVLWESFHQATPDISFKFEMKLAGLRAPAKAKIVADLDRVYENERIQAAGATPIFEFEFKKAVEELAEKKVIRVEIVGGTGDPDFNKYVEAAQKAISDEIFDRTSGAASGGTGEKGADGKPGPGSKSFAERALDIQKANRKAREDKARSEVSDAELKRLDGAFFAADGKATALESAWRDLDGEARKLESEASAQSAAQPAGGDTHSVNPAPGTAQTAGAPQQTTTTPPPVTTTQQPVTPPPTTSQQTAQTPPPSGAQQTGTTTPPTTGQQAGTTPPASPPQQAGTTPPANPPQQAGTPATPPQQQPAPRPPIQAQPVAQNSPPVANAQQGPRPQANTAPQTTPQPASSPTRTPPGGGAPQSNPAATLARKNADAKKSEAAEARTLANQLKSQLDAARTAANNATATAAGAEEQIEFSGFASYELKKVHRTGHWEYSLDKYSNGEITNRFDENIGDLTAFLDDPLFFRQVNLDDPFFKQREVLVYVDGPNSEDFGKFINFVTVQLRKTHGNGQVTFDEVRIDRNNFNTEANRFRLLYGWKDHADDDRERWRGYEWRAIWSFFGGADIEEPWKATAASGIRAKPPLERRTVNLEAMPDSMKEAQVRSITVRLYYDLAGAEKVEQVTLNTDRGESSLSVPMMLPPGRYDYDYDVSWRLRGNRSVALPRSKTNESILYVDELPEPDAAPPAP